MRNKPKARALNKNKATRYPQYFNFVDTESFTDNLTHDTIIHRFRLGVTIFNRYRKDGGSITRFVYPFTDISDYWDKLDGSFSGNNTTYVIAHNAAYDMIILKHITHLTRLGYECVFSFDEGLTFIAKWRKRNKIIIVLDNTNWFPGKLSKWGEKLNLPKLDMPNRYATDEEWFTYCERDVEITEQLQRWYISFIQSNDLGNWKYTLASSSMTAFRHRFMKHPIYIPEQSKETELARQSYHGGRVECFYSGEIKNETTYKVDVNSMYPFVMRNNYFPVCVEHYGSATTPTKLNGYLRFYGVIADCTINTKYPYFMGTNGDNRVFPIGTFRTVLTTPELITLKEVGKIEQVHSFALYRMRDIFSEFVDYFYNERMKWKQQGDELRSYMFKIFLNSLYGKFGQRGRKEHILGKWPIGAWPTTYHYDNVTGKHSVIRQFGETVIQSIVDGESRHSFVAIAAHVTAYARIYLYDLIRRAGRENVYYCDTDGLMCNETGLYNLRDVINNDKLGGLKLEGTSRYTVIKAPKDYIFNNDHTLKGVRKNAQQMEDGRYIQEQWPGLNTVLERHNELYWNNVIVKELNPQIKSGVIQENGFVTPFEFGG